LKTLLVIAPQSGLAAAVRAVVDLDRYRVIGCESTAEGGPFLDGGGVDACLLDADLTDVQPVRAVQSLRQHCAACPIFIFAAEKQWEWEEEVYLLGVEHVLAKPVRGRLLNNLLNRCLGAAAGAVPSAPAARPLEPERPALQEPRTARTLQALRNLSAILSHSLQTDALLKQFLQLLREILGVNRAAIFLRKFPAGLGPRVTGGQTSGNGMRRLNAAAAMGLSPALLEHFELSLDAGIGWFINRYARILKNGGEEALSDLSIKKEFELLGAQVAIPILDRESVVGVAVFDGRLTGEPFASEELALIFHLLEELGLAIKNSWLHDQVAANHQTMADILNHLNAACVLVGRDLVILHTNIIAAQLFKPRDGSRRPLEFTDLPHTLGSCIYEAQKTGVPIPPFKTALPGDPQRVWQVTVTAFTTDKLPMANAVLVLVEDVTRMEKSHQLEIESANLRLIRRMAEQMAHAIGNSLVPISTCQQLLGEGRADAASLQSLAESAGDGVRRITRLTRQMLFLSRDNYGDPEVIPLRRLLEEGYTQAQQHFGQPVPRLAFDSDLEPASVLGDRAALVHALAEIFLNALQAAPSGSTVSVRWRAEAEGVAGRKVEIDVLDGGDGFTADSARRALEPFFSTRNVGLGLGLTVAHKVLEGHGGALDIHPVRNGQPACVRVSLPMAAVPAKLPAYTGN
jgi:signal transduction histidine kinase/DNA-binding NarL/FixJ family response regulator